MGNMDSLIGYIKKNNLISSRALKPINFCWIRSVSALLKSHFIYLPENIQTNKTNHVCYQEIIQ